MTVSHSSLIVDVLPAEDTQRIGELQRESEEIEAQLQALKHKWNAVTKLDHQLHDQIKAIDEAKVRRPLLRPSFPCLPPRPPPESLGRGEATFDEADEGLELREREARYVFLDRKSVV